MRVALSRYWAEIDTQLRRKAYERRVRVRLLISCWNNTRPVMMPFLRSLASVYDPQNNLDIQVVSGSSAGCDDARVLASGREINTQTRRLLLQRLFVVPANPRQKKIPFARVNHNKYMVTDKIAYIGKIHSFVRAQ